MSRRTPSYVCLLRSARRRTRWRVSNLGRGVELGCRVPLRREAGRQDLSIPVAGEDARVVARQLVGEVLPRGPRLRRTVALKTRGCRKESGCRDRARGTTPKGDRRQVRLQVARRPVDHPPDAALAHRRQFCFSHRTVGALARRRRFLSRCPSAKITCQLGRGGLSASPFCLWPAQV